MLQHFIIEGRYLGSAERTPYFSKRFGDLRSPRSEAFFCTLCGEVWAKCPVEGRPWAVNNVSCRKCPPTWHVPGLLSTIYWEEEFIAAFPLPVLLWEVQRELDFYDRGTG